MTPDYSIEIPNEKAATYKVVTLIISVINLLAFGYAVFALQSSSIISLLYIGLTISLVSVILLFFRPHQNLLKKTFRIEIAFFICAFTWFASGNYILGLLLFIFAMAGLVANKIPVIHFSKQEIRYPSFPEKIFLWKEINFVMLKDDILTLEMKDNRLMQFTLGKIVADSINSLAFNNFCNECLLNEA
ncbi:MAG: hypothetical protein H7X88_13325 [Gloeobacteraceae cyanobacterium ES-bin-316]|nr:hypothetical protein [Ferruginibacter sp.]